MSTFAPVYRPTKGQQTFLTREHKREARKRKRDEESGSSAAEQPSSDSDDDAKPYSVLASASTVNRTDPYHVAGLSREHPLPGYPFPHAPVKSADVPRRSSQEELAAVNPPLYVPNVEVDDQSTSLKRRHLDNITVILHRCMLKGDWDRASRAWGLLARTEIAGLGIDVRQNGRWGIGAEILMRREKEEVPEQSAAARRPSVDDASSLHDEASDSPKPRSAHRFADEGFKLAREYYERLVLQYPHTPHTQHTVNAKVFYPALFNIWVYEVQARYRHLRDEASRARRSSSHSITSDNADEHGSAASQDLASREIADATPIAERLDELLLSPPYDISEPLLRLRGMMGLWLSDLYRSLTNAHRRKSDANSSSPVGGYRNEYADRVAIAQNRQKASAERWRAKELLAKVEATGGDASAGVALRLADAGDMSE
ncbi:hypothetical protein Q7P35_005234 [Cladosporium inversicolor]